MNDGMQTTILVSLISGLLLLLIGIIGFAVKRWVEHVDSLQASMEALRTSITALSDKFVTQKQHEKDMEALKIAASFGRRSSDSCPQPDCPLIEAARATGGA